MVQIYYEKLTLASCHSSKPRHYQVEIDHYPGTNRCLWFCIDQASTPKTLTDGVKVRGEEIKTDDLIER